MSTLVYTCIEAEQLLTTEIVGGSGDGPADLVVRVGDIENLAACVRFVAHNGDAYEEVAALGEGGVRTTALALVDGPSAAWRISATSGGDLALAHDHANDGVRVVHDGATTLVAPRVAADTVRAAALHATTVSTPNVSIGSWRLGADGDDLAIGGDGWLCVPRARATDVACTSIRAQHVRLEPSGDLLLTAGDACIRRQATGSVAWCGNVVADAISSSQDTLLLDADTVAHGAWSLLSSQDYQIRKGGDVHVVLSDMGCRFGNIRTFRDHTSIERLECTDVDAECIHAEQLTINDALHAPSAHVRSLLADTCRVRDQLAAPRVRTDRIDGASVHLHADEVHVHSDEIALDGDVTCNTLTADKSVVATAACTDLDARSVCVDDLCIKHSIRICDTSGENEFARPQIIMMNDIIQTLRVYVAAGEAGELELEDLADAAPRTAPRAAPHERSARGTSVVINDVVTIDGTQLLSSVAIVAAHGIDVSAQRITNLAHPESDHDAVTLAHLVALLEHNNLATTLSAPAPSTAAPAPAVTSSGDASRVSTHASDDADAYILVRSTAAEGRSARISFEVNGRGASAGFDAASSAFFVSDGVGAGGTTPFAVETLTGRATFGGEVVVANGTAAELSLRSAPDGDDRAKLSATPATATLDLGAWALHAVDADHDLSVRLNGADVLRATPTEVRLARRLRLGEVAIGCDASDDVEFARAADGLFATLGDEGGYNVRYATPPAAYREIKRDGHGAVWRFDRRTGIFSVHYDATAHTGGAPAARTPFTQSLVVPFQHDATGVTTGLLTVQRDVDEQSPLVTLRRLSASDHATAVATASIDVDGDGALRVDAPAGVRLPSVTADALTCPSLTASTADVTTATAHTVAVSGALSADALTASTLTASTLTASTLAASTLSAGAAAMADVDVGGTLTAASAVVSAALEAHRLVAGEARATALSVGGVFLASDGALAVGGVLRAEQTLSVGGALTVDGQTTVGPFSCASATADTINASVLNASQLSLGSTLVAAHGLNVDGTSQLSDANVTGTLTAAGITTDSLHVGNSGIVSSIPHLSCQSLHVDQMVAREIEHITSDVAFLQLNHNAAANDLATGVVAHYTRDDADFVAGYAHLADTDDAFAFFHDIPVARDDTNVVIDDATALSAIHAREIRLHSALGAARTTIGGERSSFVGDVSVGGALSVGSRVDAASLHAADATISNALAAQTLSVASAYATSLGAGAIAADTLTAQTTDTAQLNALQVATPLLSATEGQIGTIHSNNVGATQSVAAPRLHGTSVEATTLTVDDASVAQHLSAGSAFIDVLRGRVLEMDAGVLSVSTAIAAALSATTASAADLSATAATVQTLTVGAQATCEALSAGALFAQTLALTDDLDVPATLTAQHCAAASLSVGAAHLEQSSTARALSVGALHADGISLGSGWSIRVEDAHLVFFVEVDGVDRAVHKIRHPTQRPHVLQSAAPYAR